MSGLLYLLTWAPALSLLLLLPGCLSEEDATGTYQTNVTDAASSLATAIMQNQSYSSPSAQPLPATKTPQAIRTTTSPPITTTTTTTTTTATVATTTATPISVLFKKECAQLLLVNGGLILLCFILLLSTLLLTWRVCHLNRRLRALGTNGDLISSSEYRIRNGKENKSKEAVEAKETTMLMGELSQTQDETNNGAAKEDGGNANEDGPKGEEEKAGDATSSGEAVAGPVTSEEKSSSEEPQASAQSASAQSASTQSASTVTASSSESKEQPKDVA